MHLGEAASQFASAEIWEARYPVLWERCELAADSCGPGRRRGGLGVDAVVRTLDDACVTTVVERTRPRPGGCTVGSRPGPTAATWQRAGRRDAVRQGHGPAARAGTRLVVRSGGGGGYGSPAEREPERVHEDLADGYISEAHARRHYPQAFTD